MERMECIFCRRPLQHATVMLAGNPVGPHCARIHNLIGSSATGNKRVERVPKPPKQPKSYRDPHTVDLFEEINGAESEPRGSIGTMEASVRGVATAT